MSVGSDMRGDRSLFLVSCVLAMMGSMSTATGKKSCMQSGIGPKDLYQNGAMNPNYMWYRVGDKVQVPVVLDPNYSKSMGMFA